MLFVKNVRMISTLKPPIRPGRMSASSVSWTPRKRVYTRYQGSRPPENSIVKKT